MTRTLHISPAFADTIHDAARRAYPKECCGLIEGVETSDGWRAVAVHEARNLSDEPARAFLIDPEAQFRLLRALRGTERSVIGCFHSHPNGSASPSDRDRHEAAEDGFLWLIVGGNGDVAAFAFDAAARNFSKIAMTS